MTPNHLFGIAALIMAALTVWLIRRTLRRRISARLSRLVPVIERARGAAAAEEVLAAYRSNFGDVAFVSLDDAERERLVAALRPFQPWFQATIEQLLGRIELQAPDQPAEELENESWYQTAQELLEAYLEIFWASGEALDACLTWLDNARATTVKEAIWSALAWEIPEPELLPRLWKAYETESDLAVQRRLAPWISEIVFDAVALADSSARSPARQIAESLREKLIALKGDATDAERAKLETSLDELRQAFEEADQHDGADRAAG